MWVAVIYEKSDSKKQKQKNLEFGLFSLVCYFIKDIIIIDH